MLSTNVDNSYYSNDWANPYNAIISFSIIIFTSEIHIIHNPSSITHTHMATNTLPENLANDAQKVISLSQEAAIELQSPVVESFHLLLGLLDLGDGLAHTLLTTVGVPVQALREKLASVAPQVQDPPVAADASPDSIALSEEVIALFIKMSKYAKRLNDTEIGTHHIFFILLKHADKSVKKICAQYNVPPCTKVKAIVEEYATVQQEQEQERAAALKYIIAQLKGEEEAEQPPAPKLDTSTMREKDVQEVGGTMDSIADNLHYITHHINFPSASIANNSYSETPVLDNFSKDLSKMAQEGKIDPPIGRDKEIERIAQILSRRKKNNALLIGEPGVGKTAIAEGLALKIMQEDIAVSLLDKRVVSLDVTSLVAGTKYRGQFEERIHKIITELTASQQVILFIDEIHTIIGGGSAVGALDVANILKPALARGDIQCIGATTIAEYRNHLEKDGALARRFQNIMVEPTTVEASIDILKNLQPFYEKHHAVTYSEDILKACVELSERYITNRPLPDKAIDIMDEVGASVHMRHIEFSYHIQEIQRVRASIKPVKALAVEKQAYEIAAKLRQYEQRLTKQLVKEKKKWKEEVETKKQPITMNDVANVISNITQVPAERIAHQEDTTIRNLKQAMQAQIIGQDEAIDKVVKTIHRTHIGLQDPNRPLGVFIFLGPTGVGKTALAKSLATNLFANSDQLIRIDMSEYMEKIAVTRLIGAPPGYVGYEAGGQLTEKIRNHPYSVILLDEIEKAHPDVFNLLLQMMDDGVLTDGLGRTINCKNTIIILSSNVGAADLSNHNIGFQHPADDMAIIIQEKLQKSLKSTFSPEFINRLDDVVIFKPLTPAAVQQIVEIQLQQLIERTQALGYPLEVSQAAKDFIAQKGYNTRYGARLIKRMIQQHVEDMITAHIIEQQIQAQDTIYIDHTPDSAKLSLTLHAQC